MTKATRSTVVDVPMNFFYAIVLDYEGYPSFSRDVRTAEIVARQGHVTDVAFTIRVLTRPFDYCLRIVAEPPNVMHWSLVHSTRLAQNDGGWTLKDLGDGRTEVTYWNELAAKRLVPKTFINALARTALPRMLREWKDHAEQLWAARSGAAPA